MKRIILAILLLLAALASGLAELWGGLLPTISWPFTLSRDFALLRCDFPTTPMLAPEGQLHYFGWLCVLLTLLISLRLLLHRQTTSSQSELSLKWQRFKSIKRGYAAFILLMVLILLAGLNQCIAGKRALVVSYQGQLSFPAFTRAIIQGKHYGLGGNAALAETDYAQLLKQVGSPNGPDWVLMPPIPYSANLNATSYPTEQLALKGDCLWDENQQSPYNGFASYMNAEGQELMRLRFRKGLPDGQAQGWSESRRLIYLAQYSQGKLLHEQYTGEGQQADYLQATQSQPLHRIYYHPAPPLKGGHLLGTNSQGADIAAILYEGLQVNIQAILFYIPCIYAIGLSMGMLMGYYGGSFDLLSQRLIEILSQLPFIFVVMVLADFLPSSMQGMLLILLLLSLFGWMQMTYLIRTATRREKSRDYVSAARVMGASTPRILFTHILPNLTSILITLLPFSVAALILALASLDYLGFGLPDQYASWGRLLNDGLGKLSSPWVLSSAFAALVFTLLLISFIGEAVREAFDPRKHSYYR
ncbi:MAG: ABC transporter permease subunit [Akkermansia sp.]